MKTDISKFYNQTAKMVAHQNGGRTDSRSQLIKDWTKKSRIILDIGCNDGSEDVPLIKTKKRVYGLDISIEAVKTAKRNGVNAKVFDVSSSQPLPFKAETFDTCLAGEIIEHLVDTDSFLTGIHKVLKKRGKLIITTPNLASLGRRLLLLFGRNPFIETSLTAPVAGADPVGHLRYFTKDTLEDLLRVNGFKIIESTSDIFSLGSIFRSRVLAKLFPSLSWRLIVLAEKTKIK